MIAFLSNIFGYLLNYFYNFIGNYGIAIILFSLVVKLLMIPLSIKQQKSQQKSMKLQNEMKQIQFKYKNDPEKLNQETMALYKRENMSPFSGCLLAIIQMILLFSVFYMVREPLTYMKKINSEQINNYVNVLKEENMVQNQAYAQISVISEANNIKELEQNENMELSESQQKLKDAIGDNLDNICTNMKFLDIDLSKVPTQSTGDYKVYIIPVLYVLSSVLSMKLTTSMSSKKNKNKVDGENIVIVDNSNEETEENTQSKELIEKKDEEDPMAQATKNMSLLMPIMAVSISLIAPLGLALYWLTNNILMILERIVLNKLVKDEEE
ncbi:MAG: YidC/Oxa1 family membrane protein insertase [Clostridia bacterium]|nr:YidC/Oxa1 family membrane protein insertase [Clostridia bacterium]